MGDFEITLIIYEVTKHFFLLLVIWLLISRVRERNKPGQPRELRVKEHFYFPFQYSLPHKGLLLLIIVIAFFVLLPSFGRVVLLIFDREDLESSLGGFFVIGAFLFVRTVRKPRSGKTLCVVTDEQGVTVKSRDGGCESYSYRDYQGCKGKGMTFRLVFFPEGGPETRVCLADLCRKDQIAVAYDLQTLMQFEKLQPEIPEGDVALSVSQLALMLERGLIKRAQPKPPAVPAPSASSASSAAFGTSPSAPSALSDPAKDAIRAFEQEHQQMREDPVRYGEYMRRYAAKLDAEQKRQIVQKAERGEMLQAIKQCREQTGLGLREAKEMVEAYKTYLMEDFLKPAITAAPTPMTADILKPAVTTAPTPMTADILKAAGTAAPMSSGGWVLRITDREQPVTDANRLESEIDRALSMIGSQKEEFFVLAPPAPVEGISFLQVCRDTNGIFFHIEAGTEEQGDDGHPVIFCRDHVMNMEIRDICLKYYRGQKPDLGWWDRLKS